LEESKGVKKDPAQTLNYSRLSADHGDSDGE
jgi:hypothetical protein